MDGRIAGTNVISTGTDQEKTAFQSLSAAAQDAGVVDIEDISAMVATGYGRSMAKMADRTVTEITCHARGGRAFVEAAHVIVDIGGQDSKVIRLDEDGMVADFVMNDKCAAGTGRFLEVMAERLEVPPLSGFRQDVARNEEAGDDLLNMHGFCGIGGCELAFARCGPGADH